MLNIPLYKFPVKKDFKKFNSRDSSQDFNVNLPHSIEEKNQNIDKLRSKIVVEPYQNYSRVLSFASQNSSTFLMHIWGTAEDSVVA